jgi:hypothetical protein
MAKARAGIVLLETRTAKDEKAQGTGFLIDQQGDVVTNFHVIRDACYVQASLGTESISTVGIVVADAIQDVAVLRFRGLSGTPLDLGSKDDLVPGSRVIAIGFPLAAIYSRDPTISDGIYSGTSDFGEGRSLMRISAPISHGSSGGPLLDERGKVVGITAATMSYLEIGSQNLNLAVPIDVIRRVDLTGPARLPSDTCHDFSVQAGGQEAALDPKDDRAALDNFKRITATIVETVRGAAMVKESDRADTSTREREQANPSSGMGGGVGSPDNEGSPMVFATYNYSVQWYAVAGEYRFNVYSVDPQLSIVTTFMGYVEIPITTYRQKVKLESVRPGDCDGLFYGECLGRGGKVTKERAIHDYETKSVWGLSYQEGKWRITRVLPPEAASAFLRAVTKVDRSEIYRVIVGPQH